MPVLNTRWAGDGPRRRLNAVHAPTRAAPTGPTRTAAASVAVVLADQERFPSDKRVAVDSEITSSKPRTAISRQEIQENVNGPRTMRTTPTAKTVAM